MFWFLLCISVLLVFFCVLFPVCPILSVSLDCPLLIAPSAYCNIYCILAGVLFMVFNATFNKIWAISWRSVLLVQEAGVPAENHRPVASHWQLWSNNVVYSTLHLNGIRTHNFSGKYARTDCIGSCKSTYHDDSSILAIVCFN